MKKTKIIGFIIFILLVCLLCIILFVLNLIMVKNDYQYGEKDVEGINLNNVQKNILSSTNVTENSNEIYNETSNEIDDVFDTEEGDGTWEYSREQLNKISFELIGINDEISRYIKDMDEFKITVKEYVYKNGLVDANIAEVQKYEYQESTNRFGIIFKLNNPTEDKLRVIINPNGSVDISNYR